LYCGNNPINAIDPWGLWTFYVTGTASGGALVVGSVQVGIVFDDNGNVGIIEIAAIGGGTPAFGMGVSFGWTDADTIFDLQGEGRQGGFTLGPVTIERTTWNFEGPSYGGWELTFGAGTPLEGHILRTFTNITPIRKTQGEATREMQETWDESLYDVKSIGEGRLYLQVLELLNSF